MTLKPPPTWLPPWIAIALALSACAHPAPAPSPEITLTQADRTPAADPPIPNLAPPVPVADGPAERAALMAAVILPLMAFSLEQEAAIAAERQRAAAIIAKVDAAAAQSRASSQ